MSLAHDRGLAMVVDAGRLTGVLTTGDLTRLAERDPAFLDLAEESEGRTAVVVAHGLVIRVLLSSVLEGYGPSDFEGFAIDLVALNDLRREGGRWRAAELNATIEGAESPTHFPDSGSAGRNVCPPEEETP